MFYVYLEKRNVYLPVFEDPFSLHVVQVIENVLERAGNYTLASWIDLVQDAH